MFKNFIAGLGIRISQHFFLFLFGGVPPVHDKEVFRQWCLKNHHWIVLVAKRTTNIWDDAIANMLLVILQTPELFDPFWDAVTKNQEQIKDDLDFETKKEILGRIRSAIRLRFSENEKSTLSAMSILSTISNLASIIKIP